MGDVKLNSSGGGSVILTPPNTASNYTVTLPAATSTLGDTTSTQTLTNKTLTAAGSNTVEATSGPTSTQLAGNRNKIINGAMMISQAAAGGQIVYGGPYPVDRWRPDASFNNSWAFQQNAGSVTPPAGFSNYVGFTNGTAYSVAATDNLLLSQAIEGYNIADLAWGTANAKSVTLSFWVRSSIIGQHGGVVTNNTGRTYPFAYNISAANTWTYITVTIAGDTSGTWLTNNGTGLRVYFGLAEGSSNVATAGSWYAGSYFGASGSVSLAATAGSTWYITGVQLEKGATATPFENRLYGTELALCQRYFETSNGVLQAVAGATGFSTNTYFNAIQFAVSKRSAPTISCRDPSGVVDQSLMYKAGASFVGSLPSMEVLTTSGFGGRFSNASVTDAGLLRFSWTASAEL